MTIGDLDQEIAALADRPTADLQARWQALYGAAPPGRVGRDLLIRAVAHALQAQAIGEFSPALRRRLQRLAADIRARGDVAISTRPRVKPGTRLIRQWKDETHEVTVLDDSFLWRGQSYRSLSQIARAITGTRWSGPVFFGLKQRTGRPVGSTDG